VGLARASLAVGKDGPVVALHHCLKNRRAHLLVHLLLLRAAAEYGVEIPLPRSVRRVLRGLDVDAIAILGEAETFATVLVGWWAHAAVHLHALHRQGGRGVGERVGGHEPSGGGTCSGRVAQPAARLVRPSTFSSVMRAFLM